MFGTYYIFRGGEILISTTSKNLSAPLFSSSKEIPVKFNFIEQISPNTYTLSVSKETPAPDGYEFANIRENYRELSQKQFIELSTAKQIAFWRDTHNFCSSCGSKLSRCTNERAMQCKNCSKLYFPKICPCVIVAVTKEDRVLLAHNKNFKPGAFSIIAGFMEAGETPEETVRREVMEEVGIEIKDIEYTSSQSWPFPDALMLGFTAKWKSGEITPDGVEIEEADWFTEESMPQTPSTVAIGGRLIKYVFDKLKEKNS